MNIDSKAARLRGCTHRGGKALKYTHTTEERGGVIKHYTCADCGRHVPMRQLPRPKAVQA